MPLLLAAAGLLAGCGAGERRIVLEPRGWDHYAVTEGGAALRIGYTAGTEEDPDEPCFTPSRLSVQETDAAVSVRLVQSGAQGPLGTGEACSEAARTVEETVRLARPLAGRKVVDAARPDARPREVPR